MPFRWRRILRIWFREDGPNYVYPQTEVAFYSGQESGHKELVRDCSWSLYHFCLRGILYFYWRLFCLNNPLSPVMKDSFQFSFPHPDWQYKRNKKIGNGNSTDMRMELESQQVTCRLSLDLRKASLQQLHSTQNSLVR